MGNMGSRLGEYDRLDMLQVLDDGVCAWSEVECRDILASLEGAEAELARAQRVVPAVVADKAIKVYREYLACGLTEDMARTAACDDVACDYTDDEGEENG